MKLNFVLDVDGVMTTGQFLYSQDGKAYKIFGPHDAEGLKMIRNHILEIKKNFLKGVENGPI